MSQLPDSPADGRWSHQLRAVSQLPPSDSSGLARWLIHPALRWAQERPAGEVLERHARLMLTLLADPGADAKGELDELVAHDPVVVDAGLFDGGLFARYLAEGAGPDLLARAGPVADWERQPISVLRVERVKPDAVTLHDLWSDQQRTCWPWERVLPAGSLLYGRLVPLAGGVPLAFALPPITVDRRCAARILRARRQRADAQERLRAVARSRRRELATHSRSA